MNNRIYIAVDFDECLVSNHLAVLYGNAFDKKYNIISSGSGRTEADALFHLLSRYAGRSLTELNSLADEVVSNATWRDGALDFLKYVSINDNIDLEIVSSGLDIPILKFLKKFDINQRVLSCTLSIENDICMGAGSIISANDKRSIVEKAQKKYKKNRVVSIGHSSGDFEMMKIARSICIPQGNKDCESVAELCCDNFYEVILWLKDLNEKN